VRKTLIAALLTVSVVSAFAQESSRTPHAAAVNTPDSRAHVLTRQELDKLLARPQDLLVIDVRRPDEVSKIGGLPVYLSIQLNDLEKSLAWIPKGRTIVTVTTSDDTGRDEAVSIMRNNGAYDAATHEGVVNSLSLASTFETDNPDDPTAN